MAEWIGNLFLTAGSGITLTKPDTQGHGGTTISANAGTGPSIWSSGTAYVAGDLVIDRGGIWEAVAPNTSSQPISGNANWTLVGGTPYVAYTLTPSQIRTSNSVPLTWVPAPGAGLMVLPTSVFSVTVLNSIPFRAVSGDVYHAADPTSSLLTGANPITIGEEIAEMFAAFFDVQAINNIDPSLHVNQGLTFIAFADDLTGAIATSAVNAAGSGYAPGNTFDVQAAGAIVAQGVVDTVGGGGAVTAYTITTAGNAYLAGTTKTTTATTGVGIGLTIDILTVTPANGTARVVVYYDILTVP